jgi:hypothetical protein
VTGIFGGMVMTVGGNGYMKSKFYGRRDICTHSFLKAYSIGKQLNFDNNEIVFK